MSLIDPWYRLLWSYCNLETVWFAEALAGINRFYFLCDTPIPPTLSHNRIRSYSGCFRLWQMGVGRCAPPPLPNTWMNCMDEWIEIRNRFIPNYAFSMPGQFFDNLLQPWDRVIRRGSGIYISLKYVFFNFTSVINSVRISSNFSIYKRCIYIVNVHIMFELCAW